MMHRIAFLILGLILVSSVTWVAYGQGPGTSQTILFSGTAPGQDGPTDLTFKLYNAETGGTFLNYTDAQAGPGGPAPGQGRAGDFLINNFNNSATALFASTVGTGQARSFEINNDTNDRSALSAATNGLGRAGEFLITRISNNRAALFASTNGSGSAVEGVVESTDATAIAGSFHIDTVSNSSTALAAKTGGGGGALGVPPPRFAYVANEYSNDVSAYSIDAETGALTPIPGSPFGAGSRPQAVAVDPSGHFVYVANLGGNVSGYTIDATTGVLTPIPNSPFPASGFPISVAVHPTAEFAYVVNNAAWNVYAYAINAATGALTRIPGGIFDTGARPFSVAIDPAGRFAYVANGGVFGIPPSVSAYTINAATGALTEVLGSPYRVEFESRAVTVDPTGQFVYVASIRGDILAYTIDPASGALTPVPGSPFHVAGGPRSVAVDPTGQFAYVAPADLSPIVQGVAGFTIDSTTGALTPVPDSPFAAGPLPQAVTVDPSGQFVYVVNCGTPNCFNTPVGSVSAYTIDPMTGALTEIPDSPFPAGTAPASVVVTVGPQPKDESK